MSTHDSGSQSPGDGFTRRRLLDRGLKSAGALASVSGLSTVLAACGSSGGGGGGSNGETVTLGAVLSLTGSGAGFAEGTVNGLRLATDMVNKAGGIKSLGGAKVQLKVYDTQSKPDVAGTQTQKAIQDGAVIVTGCNQSPASVIASQICERSSIPFITATDFDPSLTGRGFKFMFQTDPFLNTYADLILGYAKELGQKNNAVPQRLGILCDNTDVGQSAQKALQAAASKHDYQVAQSDTYDISVKDFGPFIARMRSSNVDLLMGFQTPGPSISIVKAMYQQHFTPMGFGGMLGGQVSLDYLKGLGPKADYTLASSAWGLDLDIPGLKGIADAYDKRFGKEMEDTAAAGFSAMAVMWDSLERAKSDDPKKLRDAIAATDLKPGDRNYLTLSGCKFDSKGYNTRAAIDIKQIKDGKAHSIAPPQYASSFKPIWPAQWS